jgi:hypothetical protein
MTVLRHLSEDALQNIESNTAPFMRISKPAMNAHQSQSLLSRRNISLPCRHSRRRSVSWRRIVPRRRPFSPMVQRQLKIVVILRRALTSSSSDVSLVSLNDGAVVLPLRFPGVVAHVWVALSCRLAHVGVDSFLPGAREPPPEDYKADSDYSTEHTDGDGPAWRTHRVWCLSLVFISGLRRTGCGVECGVVELNGGERDFVWRLRDTMMLSLSCPIDVSDLSTCNLGAAGCLLCIRR